MNRRTFSAAVLGLLGTFGLVKTAKAAPIVKRKDLPSNFKPNSHADVEAIKERATLTLAWDFILAEGDTIKDKCYSLYSVVSSCCYEKVGSEPAIVIANKAAIFLFIVNDKHFNPVYQELKDITYAGQFKTQSSHGYQTNFLVYEDNQLKDEVVIYRKGEVKVIKIFNLCS